MTSKPSRVSLAPVVGREAGVPPAAVSDSASLHASNTAANGGEPAGFAVSDLLAGRPEPDVDFVPLTLRLPRYLVEALRAQANLTRRPQQGIATDLLRAGLDASLVSAAYRKAAGE